jgi:hypothetical protein
MNVRSKYDTDEPEKNHINTDHMRGMCGLPYEMMSGPARVDVSELHAPNFIRRFFELLGWKTKSHPTD